MLEKIEYYPQGHHVLAYGKQEQYAYLENGVFMGKTNLVINDDDQSIYIDYFEIIDDYQLKGKGKQMLHELFDFFPHIKKVWGISREDVLTYFWSKQEGYECTGECSDEYEGYFSFELKRK